MYDLEDSIDNVSANYILTGQICYIICLLILYLSYQKSLPSTFNFSSLFIISYILIIICFYYFSAIYIYGMVFYATPVILFNGILIHISNYLKYKKKLRIAIKKYRKTGEKSNINLPEYKSLGSLGLIVVVNILGLASSISTLIYFLTEDDVQVHFNEL